MKINEHEFNEVNLRAGLEAIPDLTMSAYKDAIKLYNRMDKAGADSQKAIEEILEQTVEGLPDAETKLMLAREAAGVTLSQRGDETEATEKLHAWAEERAVKKVRASKQPSDPSKVSKRTLLKWAFLGLLAGWALSYVAFGIAGLTSGDTWSPWVLWWLIIPLAIVGFTAYGYRKAIRPTSNDDSEDETTPAFTAQSKA